MNNIFELLYLIEVKKLSTQREFSQALNMSLGKVNKIVKDAVDAGYILADSYSITQKGQELLESNKVDNAVIMAAGFGSRFVPMTYDTPKGLLEVYGEVMIERQIKQLHEVGIKDITIVVGYLKEKFEYLTDEFGVKLIFNPDYSIKNNISTLFYAKEELKNTYVLTSDIYMTENLYRPYESFSFYAAEYSVEETDEWTVKINKDNLITEVNPEGGKDAWIMYGPTFFKEDFSKKIVELIDSYYTETKSAQWYWEDVYLRHLDDLDMYIRKYPNDIILEFESLEELRVYDKSYLEDARSEILDIIKTVFDVSLSEIVEISTLKAGMTNDSFLFDVKGEKYVFRNPGVGTEFLINRKQEAEVYSVIKELNMSDDVIYLQPDKGYKITRFIHDSRTIDHYNKKELELALTKLRTLHNSGLETKHAFDIKERIEFYHNLCLKNRAILFGDFDEVYTNIKNLLGQLDKVDREKKLSHVDSVYDNFLYDGTDVTLLDWEYAGMADPLIDIAMYVLYAGLQDNEIVELLDMYLERIHTDEELLVVHSYIALGGLLWSLWTQYKQACGEDFGTYGMEQYQYARKYSRIALKEFSENA
ncbi:MAG: NTP transferase domain-containing protein [Erysipelothrix sp.]|nr:NTP transferase domain-containing protein [Erysipelothrix sp.]